MSPLTQSRRLLPLLTTIRDHLAGGRYACDPDASRAAIDNAVRRALNDARGERS